MMSLRPAKYSVQSPFPFRFRGVLGATLWLLAAVAASAQLNLTIAAESTVDVTYNPGEHDPEMPMYDSDPSLMIATVSTAPSSLAYNGATGTFQMDFLAPTGYRFSVNPLDGPVNFNFWIAYTTYNSDLETGPSGGLQATGEPTVTFLGLEGAAPTFTINATLSDLPHAYLSVGVDAGEVTQAFSFTGLRYSVSLDGVGEDVNLYQIEGGQISVSDNNYQGLVPPDHAALLSVTSAAIPEPATYAAFAGLAALLAAGHARRRGAR